MRIKVNPTAFEKQFRIQSLEAHNNNLALQVADLAKSKADLESSIKAKTSHIADLKQKMDVSSIQKQLSSEAHVRKEKLVDHLERQVGQLLTTVDEYKAKKERYLSQMQEMEQKMQKEEEHLGKFQEKLVLTDKKIEEEEMMIERMKVRNSQVVEEIKKLRETIIDKESEIGSLNHQVNRSRKEAKN